MKSLSLIISFFVLIQQGKAQSISQDIIATTGDYYSNSNATLSFTTGELFAENLNGLNNSISQGFQQTSFTFWIGSTSAAWENLLNWNPNIVPDVNAEVVILSSRPVNPILTSNRFCRNLMLRSNASLTINTGFTLSLKR